MKSIEGSNNAAALSTCRARGVSNDHSLTLPKPLMDSMRLLADTAIHECSLVEDCISHGQLHDAHGHVCLSQTASANALQLLKDFKEVEPLLHRIFLSQLSVVTLQAIQASDRATFLLNKAQELLEYVVGEGN